MTPEEALRRCQDALDNDDPAAAEFWLLVSQALYAEAEDRAIARGLRTLDVYAAAQEWQWLE
jgi:hypothetical protein